MEGLNTKNLIRVAIIAALYATLTFVFAFMSFGSIQFRISEVLTLLPLFGMVPVYGVTLGCFVANYVGFCLGQTMMWDLLLGTLATFLAALLTYAIGRTKNKNVMLIFGALPVVVLNAVIVGAIEITYIIKEGFLLYNMLSVAFGEFVVCYLLGVPFIYALMKNDYYKKLF